MLIPARQTCPAPATRCCWLPQLAAWKSTLVGSQVNQQLQQLGFLRLEPWLIFKVVRDISEAAIVEACVEEVAGRCD